MIQKFNIAIIILALSSLTFGQVKSRISRQSDPVTQSIIKIEQKMADALTKGDTAFLESCLTDTFVFLSPFGNLLNKTQVIEDVKSGALQMQSLKLEDIKVQVNTNSAIVTYRSTNKGVFKFVDISGKYQWIDVFENRNGQWQLIYQQGTPISRSK